jgi:hypothetical protein
MRGNHFAAYAHVVGWIKRGDGKIGIGFGYLNAPQMFEIATKSANPTRTVADRRLDPTTIYRLGPQSGHPFFLLCRDQD